MSNDTRRPGPWDRPEGPHRAAPTVPDPSSGIEPPPVRGQHPAIAIGGTLLFAGFIWWISGSWIVALALIFGLIVHEYGHVLAMNRLGMGPAKIYIIPFLGGVAAGQRAPRSVWDGVKVSLAGPLFGLLATIPFFALGFVLGDPMWLLGAFVISMINLINLAPAPPLDGAKALGPVLARIHPWVEQGAMLAIGAIVIVWALTRGSYIFGVFMALALFGHLRQGARPHAGRPLTNVETAKSIGLYLTTAAACVGVGLVAPTMIAGDPWQGLSAIGSWLGLTR
ncbi:metalloprotease [Brevundimonas aveniformis]|uniref:metalloprotease n=1 Tax=Brevundimonas aveniformis TaxID=370977 RepID=UPI00041E3355|nr:site-2 protease family protein [Brevundimonas aveniformis]